MRHSTSAHLLGIPDLPEDAFKHVGNRKIKPQGLGKLLKWATNGKVDVTGVDLTKPITKLTGIDLGDASRWINNKVEDIIPGGWTTVAQVGLALTPAGALGSAALGAASGGTGGFRRKGFDLSGAIMGGLQGYGVGSLTTSLASAAGYGAPTGFETGANYDLTSAQAPYSGDVGYSAATDYGSGANYSFGSTTPVNPAGVAPVDYGLASGPAPASAGLNPYAAAGRSAASSAGTGLAATSDVAGSFQSPGYGQYPTGGDLGLNAEFTPAKIKPPTALENLGSGMADKASQVGQGVQNLVGAGPQGLSGIMPAAQAVNAGMSYTAYAGLGAVALEAAAKKNQDDYDKGNISNEEYLENQRRIDQAVAEANANVQKYRYEAEPELTQEQATLYGKRPKTLYDQYVETEQPQTTFAFGGSVENYAPPEDMNAGGLANGFKFSAGSQMPMYAMGGEIPEYGIGGYARGGEPRFLSGGGDGMSDSIKARIDGKQEARLADGEFVIPADVVSHLGNGSSKAGAKQLHAMMNRIRKARTGNPKQGKQINPIKFMPA
jgi:hypothetical protein